MGLIKLCYVLGLSMVTGTTLGSGDTVSDVLDELLDNKAFANDPCQLQIVEQDRALVNPVTKKLT